MIVKITNLNNSILKQSQTLKVYCSKRQISTNDIENTFSIQFMQNTTKYE